MENFDQNAHGLSHRQIVRSLLSEAKQELAALRDDEAALSDKHALMLRRAWRLGELPHETERANSARILADVDLRKSP
jgi:hypothetical protein